MRTLLSKAMRDTDHLVVQLEYLDAKGQKTTRVVSPIRYLAQDRLLALCLSRCAPRQFYLSRCENVQLKPAHEFVMPVPLGTQN